MVKACFIMMNDVDVITILSSSFIWLICFEHIFHLTC